MQYLKIPMPALKTRAFNRPAAGGGGATVETLSHYYVELRTPQDFDGMLGNRSVLAPQVLLHVGGDARGRGQRGLHTFLLDTTPATTGRAGFADAALGVGKTFSDPAGGLTITVQSVSATQATIAVVVPGGTAAPTCIDDTPFTAPGPGPASCVGGRRRGRGRGRWAHRPWAPRHARVGPAGGAATAAAEARLRRRRAAASVRAPRESPARMRAAPARSVRRRPATSPGVGGTSGAAGGAPASTASHEAFDRRRRSGCGCETTTPRGSLVAFAGLFVIGAARRRRPRA